MSTTPIATQGASISAVPPAGSPPSASSAVPAREKIYVKTDHLITEDGLPVESYYHELQMRLLTDALTSSWLPGRPYIVAADVGIFWRNENPAIVPDVFLAMDVARRTDVMSTEGKSYLCWDMGKPPDIVIEVVSNTDGDELTTKKQIYAANVRAPRYIVWDERNRLKSGRLNAFVLREDEYEASDALWFPKIGLGLCIWSGAYDNYPGDWLRWCDVNGQLIATGEEQRVRANEAQARADSLAAKLRELGINPDNITGR